MALLLAAALAGCSFDEPATDDAPVNCVLDTDCASGLSCEAGVCVMQPDSALDVTLEITPKRMPDGSQPFPILVGPFVLSSGPRDFQLPQPIQVSGNVHNGAERVSAQLNLVPVLPVRAPSSLAKPVSARTGLLINTFTVQLVAGTEYRVTVQPTDSASELPAYTTTYVAESGADLDIDYATLDLSRQSFMFRNLPPGGTELVAIARAKDSGRVISNSVKLSSGRAQLVFSETQTPFRVELASTQNAARGLLDYDEACGDDTVLPVISIEDTAFKSEASVSSPAPTLAVDLPVLPPAVPYVGSVKLCPSVRGEARELPMTLRSTALAISGLPKGISASYEINTTTGSDGAFCANVLPGEYVILVTPPASVACEIFAERRQVTAANASADNILSLHTPPKISGVLRDQTMMPVPDATIDAVALGSARGLMLAEDDLTVPLFNRSRQTATNASGEFTLNVDVGAYDLIIKPPAKSGLAWQVRTGNIAKRSVETTLGEIQLGAPALIEGSLRYASRNQAAQRTLAGAEVHAYTVIDERTPNARGIEIGRGQADEDGNLMLLVAPEPQRPW